MSGSGFQRISISLSCDTGVENHENERCPDSVLNGFLYSFGAKQLSRIMKMNDFRIEFGADFYIALVRKRDRNGPRFSSKNQFLNEFLFSFGAKQVSKMISESCLERISI